MTIAPERTIEIVPAPPVLTPLEAFALALAEYRGAHWPNRDSAFYRLEDAADLAGLDLCHCCANGVPFDQAGIATRPCCGEIVCLGCDEEHTRTCTVYLAWAAEGAAAESVW